MVQTPKLGDKVNGRQTSSLRLADMRKIPMLWVRKWKSFRGLQLKLCTCTATDLYREKNIRKTPKKIGKAIAKKFKNWKGRMISTIAPDIE
jgi:hypothetical protein